jgi:hypothetical protein
MSKAISYWPSGGKRLTASRSAVPLGREQFLADRGGLLVREAPGVEGADGCERPVCRAQDPAALPASGGGEPPGSAAGSRILSSWPARWSQTLWPTSSASARLSRYLPHTDQMSGAYRSTSASHACLSPVLARVTRAVTSVP